MRKYLFTAATRAGGAKGLVHDPADGTGAPATLDAATEAIIDLAGRTRGSFVARKRRAHVAVRENVAGTNDHRWRPGSRWYQVQLSSF